MPPNRKLKGKHGWILYGWLATCVKWVLMAVGLLLLCTHDFHYLYIAQARES